MSLPPDHEIMLKYFTERFCNIQNVYNDLVQLQVTALEGMKDLAIDDLLCFPAISIIAQKIQVEVRNLRGQGHEPTPEYFTTKFGEEFSKYVYELEQNIELNAMVKQIMYHPDREFVYKILVGLWIQNRHVVDKEKILWLKAENQAKHQFGDSND